MPMRRRFGRRRRYARRRRVATSRSVPRTTLAPRHQYLKLRMSIDMNYTGTATPVPVRVGICLNRVRNSLTTYTPNPGVNNFSSVAPLGWTEYGNIFAKYVVHGVKFNLRHRYRIAKAENGYFQQNLIAGYALHTTQDGTIISNQSPSQLAAYPLGGFLYASAGRMGHLKRYVSNSKIAGRPVAQYSDYIHDWDGTLGTTPPAPNKLLMSFCTENIPINDTWAMEGTITFYVSAVAIKENITAGQAMAVNALTDPGVPIGEPSKADALDHEVLLSSGVAQHKRTLEEMNMGGSRR